MASEAWQSTTRQCVHGHLACYLLKSLADEPISQLTCTIFKLTYLPDWFPESPGLANGIIFSGAYFGILFERVDEINC